MNTISSFRGEYAFLSNFYLVGGITAEHLFQADKTFDRTWADKIRAAATPAEAKKLGRRCPMRNDWNSVRVDIMRDVLKWKFDPVEHPALWAKLKATGDTILIEGNTWNDTFWGICNGIGQNWLGKLLMEIRDSEPEIHKSDAEAERDMELRASNTKFDDDWSIF